jgi:hypothetical protein
MPGKPHLIQPGNREWVTTIECVNAIGWSIPSTIIFKGKVHIEGWFDEILLPGDWRIEMSANGWTTDEIGFCWLQKVFIPATNGHTKGGYRLLVLDGNGSHLTPEFDKVCKANNIVAIYMPPHSSHLLQPLDVHCFGPLKKAYGKLVEQKCQGAGSGMYSEQDNGVDTTGGLQGQANRQAHRQTRRRSEVRTRIGVRIREVDGRGGQSRQNQRLHEASGRHRDINLEILSGLLLSSQ